MIKITATPIKVKDLKAGDLFSAYSGEEHWNHINPLAVGEKVYIRTDAECPNKDRNLDFYKITIEEIKEEVKEDASN